MKSSLYTRTGDDGTTSLVDGSRISKTAPRLEAYGTVDELSSLLGLVIADENCPKDIREQIQEVQSLLFDIGAYLATPSENGKNIAIDMTGHIAKLERNIDMLDETTPKINAFILPGGSVLSSQCHVARTVCRRAERRILDLAGDEYVDPTVIRYFNRLSDYLFIAARNINANQRKDEIIWRPSK